ncbi:MAG: putative D-alanyl-D-alanine carboxypeptidase [Actinomycetota bacterium]
MLVLVAVAALPAGALAGVWRVAEARREPGAEAEMTVPVGDPADPMATAVLSFRRHPSLVAERVAAARSRDESERLAESVSEAVSGVLAGGSGSDGCVRIEIDGEVLVDLGSTSTPVPASTQKLLVAAVALDLLGPDFRYRTEVRSPPPIDGVVDGDVVLVGGGDPLLTTDDFDDPQRHPAFGTTSLDELADLVVSAGVTTIDGAVVGDGSRYDDEFRAPSWGSGITNFDAGPYDALLVDDGYLSDGNHGLVPARSAAARFVDLLRARGVVVRDGAANQDRPPIDGEVVLAAVESATLVDVLVEMLHTSDNNTAELVLKEIGLAGAGVGGREAGLQVVEERLSDWSVLGGGLVLADGSGLSRVNRLGCQVLTGVLASVPVSAALVDALPVAGRDGTLASRLLDTPAEGRLRAKTGTLTGVKALAGEQPDRDGRPAVFAVVLNGEGVDDPSVHDPVWRAVVEFIDAHPVDVELDADEFGPRSGTGTAPAPMVLP